MILGRALDLVLGELRAAPRTAPELAEKLHLSRSHVYSLLGAAVRRGLAAHEGRRYLCVIRLTTPAPEGA